MKTSSTALEQYERCPSQYHQERIEKKRGQPPMSFRLGRVCHRVIQRLMQKHLEDGEVKPFDAALANEFYKEEWAKESGLSGEDLFTDGLQMIISFVERWSPMDPARILGIEEPFEIVLTPDADEDDEPSPDCPQDADCANGMNCKTCKTIDGLISQESENNGQLDWECPKHGLQHGPHCLKCHCEREIVKRGITAVGFMDLVLRNELIDESTGEVEYTIEVIDYKSTHAFVTTRDAESSIQLALYNMAARQKWPGERSYTCSLHMLQTGTHITVRHTPQQLAGFKQYILATASQIEQDQSWIAKLGPDCAWCHLRAECATYQKALKAHNHIATETLADLEQLGQEREEVSIRAKIFKKRLEEIDDVLKERLSRTTQPLFLAGYIFSMSKVETLEHSPKLVIELLSERLGIPQERIIEATMEVQKKRLDQLLTEIAAEQGLTPVAMVKAALANRAERKYATRMNHKKDKDTHKG